MRNFSIIGALRAVSITCGTLVASLLLSVWLHLDTALCRRVVRDELNAYVSERMRGTLHIGAFDVLALHRVVASHAVVYDAAGRPVIRAARIETAVDVVAALRGILRFSTGHLFDGRVDLFADAEGQPSFLDAFDRAKPRVGPPTGPPFHAIVDDLHTHRFTMAGELVGLRDIDLRSIEAHGRMEIRGDVDVRIWSARGKLVRPFPFDARLDRVFGRIHSDPQRGVQLYARAHTDSDRVRARVSYRQPQDQTLARHLDLVAMAEPLNLQRLSQLGFSWAKLLTGQRRGDLHLWGPVKNLQLRSCSNSSAGPVCVEARLPSAGATEVQVRTSGIHLDQIIDGAPALQLAGKAALHVPPDTDANADPEVTIEVEPLVYQSYPIPALRIAGHLTDEAFALTRAETLHIDGKLTATGTIAFNGDLQVAVTGHIPSIAADPHLRRHLGEVQGSLHVDLRARRQQREPQLLEVQGSLRSDSLRYGSVRAGSLSVGGSLAQRAGVVHADLRLDGRSVVIRRYLLGTGGIRIRGSDPNYHVTGRFSDPSGRALELASRIQRRDDGYRIDAERLVVGIAAGQEWRGAFEHVDFIPNRQVDIGRFLLASGSQRLEAHGRWSLSNRDNDFQAQLQDLDIEVLRALLGDRIPAALGRIDANLLVRGSLRHPHILLEGALRNASLPPIEQAQMVYLIDFRDNRLQIDTQIDLGQDGSATLTTTGLVDRQARTFAGELWGGTYQIELLANDLNLQLLQVLPRLRDLPLEGRIGGSLKMQGSPQAPALQLALQSPTWRYAQWSPLNAKTAWNYELGVLSARLQVGDSHGVIVETEGSLLIDLVRLLQHPKESLASLATVPWRLAARLPQRLLGQLPSPLLETIPETLRPLRTSFSATLSGGAFETRGNAHLAVDWLGYLNGANCGSELDRPRAIAEAGLRGGKVQVDLRGFLGKRQAVTLHADAPAPLSRWFSELAANRFTPPPLQVQAHLQRADLGQVPGLCAHATGVVDAVIDGTDLLTDRARARLRLTAPAVRLRRLQNTLRSHRERIETEAPVMRVNLDSEVDRDAIYAAAALDWAEGTRAQIEARLPVLWSAHDSVPRPSTTEPMRVRANVVKAPLRALLLYVPQLVNVKGELSGQLLAQGKFPLPSLSGNLYLRNGAMQVYGLGHRLHDLHGRLNFRDRTIELQQLEASDGKGHMRIDGQVSILRRGASRTRLTLQPKDFPVRREGTVLSTITGNAVLDADLTTERLNSSIVVRDLAIAIPTDSSAGLQAIEQHPDVRILGEQTANSHPAADAYPIRVLLDASRTFWVKSSTYRVQMRSELLAEYREPELRLSGYAEMLRGRIEIYGKRFEVERGSIDFDGTADVNPTVDLVLTHRLRNPQGATISVVVSGRLANPSIRFTSTESSDPSEIIALLLGSRSSMRNTSANSPAVEQQVNAQTLSFLAGLSYGMASLAARRQFGELFPIIAIENTPGAYGGARARVGFQADDIIPAKLRSFVRSAYIEGSTTLQNQQRNFANTGTVQGRGLGFLLQLEFPYSIFGAGAYAPPDNWGVDLTWEP